MKFNNKPIWSLLSGRSVEISKQFSLHIVLIILLNFITLNSPAQSINLKAEKITLKAALQKIEEQSGYYFIYSDKLIDVNKKIRINFVNEGLIDVLNKLLAETNAVYKITDRYIILSTDNLSESNLNKISVSGKVTNEFGESIPGVTIKLLGELNGTITGEDGMYYLHGVNPEAVLDFSFVGMISQKIQINSKERIDVRMHVDAIGLEEIVAVGYGVMQKNDVTGATLTLNPDVLKSVSSSYVIEAMQGKAAGVDITSRERPGTLGNITIRGVRSLTASNNPLYVIDGVPLVSNVVDQDHDILLGGIDNLNPSDIESIDILKDASATAIYGSRGANGVILITTKKGRSGKLELAYNSSCTFLDLIDNSSLMNAGEYIEWRRWAKYYSNPSVYPRGDRPNIENDKLIFLASSDPSAWSNIQKGWTGGVWNGSNVSTTPWTDMVTQTGFSTSNSLSASGGNEKMNGYASFGYNQNEGTIKGQSYTRFTSKLSFNVFPIEWFNFGGSVNVSYSVNEYGQSSVGLNNLGNSKESLYESARSVFSYALPYDSNGDRVEYPGGDIAVKTIVNEWEYSQDQRVSYRTMSSLYAALDMGKISSIFNGIKYRLNFGSDFTTFRDGVYIDKKSVNRIGTSYASLMRAQTLNFTLDNLLYYDKIIGKHKINSTFLHSISSNNYESSSLASEDIPYAIQKWNVLSQTNVSLSNWNSDLINENLMSVMGRVNYSYDNKYLLTFSGRYDGASQLSDNHKWSFFPSSALGWRLDRESFASDIKWIEQLKMRIGIGSTGNAAIAPYSTKGGLNSLFYPYGSILSNGVKNSLTLANENLGWEKTTQYNFGIDFSLFSGRFSGVVDFYSSLTTDLLMNMSIPSITGFTSTYSNIGSTSNKGIDLSLKSLNMKTKNFEWETRMNLAWSKDKIVTLSQGKIDDITNGWFIGQPQNVVFDYQSNGIWKEADAVEMAKFNANGHNFKVGMSRPKDQNGDYLIDANHDKVIIGNTRPRYIVGLTNNFKYKKFELYIFIVGRMGYLYNSGGEKQTGRFYQRSINYYNENNKNSEYQKPIYTEASGDPYSNILGYREGSFVKVKNISLSYTISPNSLRNYRVSNLKLYVQINNPGMLYSNVKWMDMDTNKSYWNRGFTTGVNLNF